MALSASTDKLALVRKTMVGFGAVSVLALFASSYFTVLGCPYPITYEGIELWASWCLGHGGNIYDLARLSAEPWLVDIYPPLMAMLGLPFAGNAMELLFVLRLFSVLSFVGTGACLWALARRLGADKASTVGALVFFASCVPVWFTSFIAKPDYLCMVLESAAWLVFWRRFQNDKPGDWYGGPVFLSVMAMLAKQQGLLAPLSIFIFLLGQRRFKSALKFGAAVVVSILLCMLVLQLVTGGFLEHLFFLRQVKWSQGNIALNFQSLGYDAIKIALLCMCALAYRPADQQARRCYGFVVTLFFVCLPELAYIFGVPGATSNHFITPLFALGLLLAIVGSRFVWVAPIMSVVSVVLVIDMYQFAASQCDSAAKGARQIVARLPRDTALLSEDPYWVLYTGDKPVIVDCTTFVNVWRLKPAEQQPLVDRINARAYGGILINEFDDNMGGGDIWTKEIVAAVKNNYKRVAEGIGNGRVQRLYLPK